jgi:hypothetical protein
MLCLTTCSGAADLHLAPVGEGFEEIPSWYKEVTGQGHSQTIGEDFGFEIGG